MFLSYGFLSDGILIPESGISALKTNCAASQTDNTAGSTHANQQIYLQNSYNSLFKSICNAVWHRLYRHLFTGLLCFFLCAMLLFCTAASPFSLLTNGSDSFFINFLFFNGAAVFLVFHVFYVYGCFSCFLFYGCNVFQCLYVLMFLACFMFLQ